MTDYNIDTQISRTISAYRKQNLERQKKPSSGRIAFVVAYKRTSPNLGNIN